MSGDTRAGAPGAGRKPVDQEGRAEGEERWTDEPEMMVSKARFEEVQQENERLMNADEMRTEWLRVAEERAERAEAKRDELYLKLAAADEAWDKQRADLERAEAERDQKAEDLVGHAMLLAECEADLERAQEIVRDLLDSRGTIWTSEDGKLTEGEAKKQAKRFLAEARERGEG